ASRAQRMAGHPLAGRVGEGGARGPVGAVEGADLLGRRGRAVAAPEPAARHRTVMRVVAGARGVVRPGGLLGRALALVVAARVVGLAAIDRRRDAQQLAGRDLAVAARPLEARARRLVLDHAEAVVAN